MTTTSGRQANDKEAEEEQSRENRRQVARLVCLFSIAIGITFVARWYEQKPPEPNYAGYYEGEWVNKRGQLISADGKVLRDRFSSAETKPADGYVNISSP